MVRGKGQIIQNKRTGKFEKRNEGEENMEKIFDVIDTNRGVGVTGRDIKTYTGLSKETVYNHLHELLNEGRIYKSDRKYYPEISIQNEFTIFGKTMKKGFYKLIDRKKIESDLNVNLPYGLGKYPRMKLYGKVKMDFPDKILTRRDLEEAPFIRGPKYLSRMLVGPIASKKYCNTTFGSKESLEKCLFEFSNRIGGYLTYIFLQALHPLKDPDFSRGERSELNTTMIENAISIEDLFIFFKFLITQLGLGDSNSYLGRHEKLVELSDNNFKAVCKGIENVYPNLYIAFENWWLHVTLNSLALNSVLISSSKCDHQWQKKHLFKYGPSNYCKKCHKCYNGSDPA